MKKKNQILSGLFAFAFLIGGNAEAQTIKVNSDKWTPVIIRGDGKATFDFEVSGDSSTILNLQVLGPKVTRVEASVRKVPKDDEIRRRERFLPWNMTFRKGKAFQEAVEARKCLSFAVELPDITPDDLPSFDELGLSPNLYARFVSALTDIRNDIGLNEAENLCPFVTRDHMDALHNLIFEVLEGGWERSDTCDFINSKYLEVAYEYFRIPPPVLVTPALTSALLTKAYTPLIEYSDYVAVMRKDACDGKRTYKVEVTLTPTHTRAAIKVRITEKKYDGKKAASIKPVSDGKFAPSPLLLIESMGICRQALSLVKWSSNKPLVTNLTIEDLIRYKGRTFNRINLSGKLRGGRASFDLENGFSGYGVCFSLVPRRQKANSYPLEE